jgi:hypothetical protein
MSALSREEILAGKTLVIERVHVPELAVNGTNEVCVRRFSGNVKQALGEMLSAAIKNGETLPKNWWATVCVLAICDENGKRLFSSNDVETLGEMDSEVLDRIYQVAARINGLSADSAEQVAKNSEPNLSVVSSSP